MPIQRRILNVGNSQAVTIPKSWLRTAEEVEGKKIIAIAMEVDGSIIMNPVFEKELKASVIPGKRATPALADPTFAGGKATNV